MGGTCVRNLAKSYDRPYEPGARASTRPWSMFKITNGPSVSDFIVLAPALGLTNDAAPIEDVLFLRNNWPGPWNAPLAARWTDR